MVIIFKPRGKLGDEEFKKYLLIVRRIANFDSDLKSWVFNARKASKNVSNLKAFEDLINELKRYVCLSEKEVSALRKEYLGVSRSLIRIDPRTLKFTIPRKLAKEQFLKLIKYCKYDSGTFEVKDPTYLNEVKEILEASDLKVEVPGGPWKCQVERVNGLLRISFNEWGAKASSILRKLREIGTLRYFIEKPRFDEEGNFLGSNMIERKINVMRVNKEEKCVTLPIGLLDKALKALVEEGITLNYSIRELPNLNIEMKKNFSLMPHQERAYELWSKRRRGTIAIFTRGGKSFIAMQAIYDLKKPTVIFVTTKELASTWREYLIKYLGVKPYAIGYLGEGERKVRPITVAIYNSAVRYLDSLKDSFELAVFDECLTRETLIVDFKGGVMPIGDLIDGKMFTELLAGGRCLGYIKKEVDKITVIKTDYGLIKTTLTHPHIVLRTEGSREGLVKLVPAKDLRIGDCLLIPDRIPHIEFNSTNVWISPLRRDNLNTNVLLNLFRAPIYILNDFLRRLLSRGEFLLNEELRWVSPPLPYEKVNLLKLLLLKYSVHPLIFQEGNEYIMEINNLEINKLIREVGLPKTLKNKKVLKALTGTEIGREPVVINLNGLTWRLAPIREIKMMKEVFKVYDFATEGHTFLANGFLTHNCHHVPANTFKDVALGIGSLYRMALSATPKRRDGNEELLYKLCGDLLVSIDYRQLLNMKIVAPIEIFKTVFAKGEEEKLRKLVGILTLHKESKALIFTQYLETARRIYEELIRRGFKVALITGSTSSIKRRRAFENFIKGSVNAIVTTTVLDEGITVPDADLAIIYEGSGEARQMIQRIGRVLGYVPGKTAKIYELIDITDPKEKRAYFRRKWVREIYHVEGERKVKEERTFIQYKIDYWNEY
ncbi:MAG: hypothetical protein B6U69_03285 [Thermofilum sp. ex4484_15]|nr:MAG: hypothetical protein B6U69_03285 [Thermofilum sp. ex4484_15]